MKKELYSEVPVTRKTADEVGLNQEEYDQIVALLGRTPTYTELGMYGVLWSEHCSYKNSIKQIKTLPRSGGRLLVDAGEENAGLVDIGDGYAICFKIESHNHPSAIEPFQGAATGVGGILRDIFSMGARPIASLNSLRFGELDSERIKFLLRGVVSGISHYGNSYGVPTVAGEIYFDDCYYDNPLVNAMAVGIVKTDQTASASARGVGNPVMIVGSSTGRDGIHGASLLASREFDEKTDDMRPTVQVGDPFAEKLLTEVTLELIQSGCVVAVQDMGAAGISCSTSEMSAKTGVGMRIDLDKVPLREQSMSAYEILLSESQERMLFVIEKGKEDLAIDICKKWDVPMVQIGEVIAGGHLEMFRHGKQVVDLVADTLVLGGGAPQNDPPHKRPAYLDEVNAFDTTEMEKSKVKADDFWKILTAPTIASKRWIFRQYDSQVRTNTVQIKGDAGVLRIKEIPGKGLALTTDSNSRYCYLDPYMGGLAAVSEAARNVVCTGAEPVAITNCLNFGNPYDPEVYWTFREAVRGMGDACRKFNTPVTGGNVSFHNESRKFAIYPTPTIGMLGVIDDLNHAMSSDFKHEGDLIVLLGNNREEMGGSEFMKQTLGKIVGKAPIVDLDEEFNLEKATLEAIKAGAVCSAHDLAEGGLAIALAEKAIASEKFGCEVDLGENITAGKVFGESQSRILVSLCSNKLDELTAICGKYGVKMAKIGNVTAGKFAIKGLIETTVDELTKAYEGAIPEIMSKRIAE
ncbi:MAG: phosphoribosylformylglycinamidine synthase subunit PurL [Candidatus Kapabacteria bacterium]|nr:phosphoribosylformylglycinamidine synthase subunit PurL [Candidatus Kapabacteria bacterium]